jgi:hypothetical protein
VADPRKFSNLKLFPCIAGVNEPLPLVMVKKTESDFVMTAPLFLEVVTSTGLAGLGIGTSPACGRHGYANVALLNVKLTARQWAHVGLACIRQPQSFLIITSSDESVTTCFRWLSLCHRDLVNDAVPSRHAHRVGYTTLSWSIMNQRKRHYADLQVHAPGG